MDGKMLSGEKITFILPDPKKEVGHGGNGKVQDVIITEPAIEAKCVAKFFCCETQDSEKLKETRYTRFCREVRHVEQFIDRGIKGIIPVLDKCCPEKWAGEYSAWYLMPKAKPYYPDIFRPLSEIIHNMLDIAHTIKEIHDLGYAHRDIKPNNLMIYLGRLCLIDFGLIWNDDLEYLTEFNERLGPTRIMPPEMEPAKHFKGIDYKKSDIYLFAKVLWIYLTKDKSGFKGPYTRDREMIYLQRDLFNIPTYEPLHQLLEQATCDDYSKRIDIDKCIELLELQQKVIENALTPEWKTTVDSLIYLENIKYQIAYNKPIAQEYTDEAVIIRMISDIIPYSSAMIYNGQSKTNISVLFQSIKIIAEKECILYEEAGRDLIQYHFNISSLKYYPTEEETIIILSDLDQSKILETERRYNEIIRRPETRHGTIYLSSNETIRFSKPTNKSQILSDITMFC